jgi:glycosyltransferase involved in cell wall biosynthesis
MFSVVIPLFNKAHIIDRTIASVLTQTLRDFELIIVNDGSTDNSLEITQKYLTDSRIKIINQENEGVSAARNKGILEAKFNYVAFLDGDDEWLPSYLAKIKEAIELFPNAGMYGCSSWHRNILTGKSSNATLNRYSGKTQEIDFFENPHIMPHTSAIVVSKKVFDQAFINGEGFPVGMKVCEDITCFNRMAFYAPLVYIGHPLGIRNSGVLGQITELSREERFRLMLHVINFYNMTYSCWFGLKDRNKAYIIFLKYDLRGRMMAALRDKDYKTINYILTELDSKIINLLPQLELNIYRNRKLNFYAKVYIYFTKLMWRRKGYPKVGHS